MNEEKVIGDKSVGVIGKRNNIGASLAVALIRTGRNAGSKK
jgi:hypothetical protein